MAAHALYQPASPAKKPLMAPARSDLAPGMFVRHPTETEWGLGQVQSVVGERVTVNFEHAGKLLINTDVIDLEVVQD